MVEQGKEEDLEVHGAIPVVPEAARGLVLGQGAMGAEGGVPHHTLDHDQDPNRGLDCNQEEIGEVRSEGNRMIAEAGVRLHRGPEADLDHKSTPSPQWGMSVPRSIKGPVTRRLRPINNSNHLHHHRHHHNQSLILATHHKIHSSL